MPLEGENWKLNEHREGSTSLSRNMGRLCQRGHCCLNLNDQNRLLPYRGKGISHVRKREGQGAPVLQKQCAVRVQGSPCVKVLHRALRYLDFILKGWGTTKGRWQKWSCWWLWGRWTGRWKQKGLTGYGSRGQNGENRVKSYLGTIINGSWGSTEVKQQGTRNQEWMQILTLACRTVIW